MSTIDHEKKWPICQNNNNNDRRIFENVRLEHMFIHNELSNGTEHQTNRIHIHTETIT